MSESSEIKFRYTLDIGEESESSYELLFDPSTHNLVTIERSSTSPAIGFKGTDPEWTHLEKNKCSNCPLTQKEGLCCPIAKNLNHFNESFAHDSSFRETKVKVETPQRTYLKETQLQEALFSIFGLIMATSGCPNMEFLKPMARFHLPFSTGEETIVRTVSMFLLRQHFLEPGTSTAALEKLARSYEEVAKVNQGIILRIREAAPGDAERNAIIVLDSFTQYLSFEMSGDFSDIRRFFENELSSGEILDKKAG